MPGMSAPTNATAARRGHVKIGNGLWCVALWTTKGVHPDNKSKKVILFRAHRFMVQIWLCGA
jgi:hypothetical protein